MSSIGPAQRVCRDVSLVGLSGGEMTKVDGIGPAAIERTALADGGLAVPSDWAVP